MTGAPDRLHHVVTLGAAAAALALAGLFSTYSRPQGSTSTAAPGRDAPERPAASPRPAATPLGESRFSPGARRRRAEEHARVGDTPAFRRLGEPRPGDWLWSFPEPGETLAEYYRGVFNQKTAHRTTLHLLPLSDLSPVQRRVIPPLVRFLSLYFDSPVAVLPFRPPAPRWYDPAREQYDAGRILGALRRQVPPRSMGLFGLMGSDLFGEGYGFVFGYATYYDRVGVYSLHRFGTHPTELLLRTLKLAAHEIGHLFSLPHCVFYRCLMNGSNSLQETDRGPIHLCPVCQAKLRLAIGFDPAARHQRLRAFYREQGFLDEAAFAERQRVPPPTGTTRSVAVGGGAAPRRRRP
jgi:archaemetzincin